MTTHIWGSDKVIIMDSGFRHVSSVIQLKEKDLYSITVIKKKIYCLKYTKAVDVLNHMAGKEVGTVQV